jgi:rRNA maturation endonuclease Nob1
MEATRLNYKCRKGKVMELENGKFKCESCEQVHDEKRKRECDICGREICEYCENQGCICQED